MDERSLDATLSALAAVKNPEAVAKLNNFV